MAFQINPAVAFALNQSIFSLSKAKLFYGNGNNDPFLAFSRREDKESKFKVKPLLSKVGIFDPKDGDEGVDFSLLEVIARVSWHMQVNVGTGYGMASALCCRVAMLRHLMISAATTADQTLWRLQLLTSNKACVRTWETIYEDAFLSGLNKAGEAFAVLLQKCVTGRQEVVDAAGVKTYLSQAKTMENLCTAYKLIGGLDCPAEEMELVLWSFRIARGISALEKREKMPKHYSEEDILNIVICGAFRRCGQGLYGRYVDPISEGTEGSGNSVWSLLSDKWDEAKLLLPKWLQKKLLSAKLAHLRLAGVKVDQATFEENNPAPDAKFKVEAVTDDDQFIPWIDIHYCDITSEETVYAYGEEYTFTQLDGAFETRILHCPVKFEYETPEEGGKPVATSCLMDGIPMKTINSEEGQIHYWIDVLPGKEIIKRAAERYPNGVFLYSRGDCGTQKKYAQFIEFSALLKLGAFAVGGAATGITLNLIQFMMSVSMNATLRPNRWDSSTRNLLTGIGGQIRKWVSSGAMKRIGKTGLICQSSKVMTSHSPRISNTLVEWQGNTYSLPTILINPNDDLVKIGNYVEGEIAAISRTPMIAKFYGVVKFDNKVSIGHIEVSALIWALANRGDGDGSPICIEPTERLVAISN